MTLVENGTTTTPTGRAALPIGIAADAVAEDMLLPSASAVDHGEALTDIHRAVEQAVAVELGGGVG
jgi:hypothetical protein